MLKQEQWQGACFAPAILVILCLLAPVGWACSGGPLFTRPVPPNAPLDVGEISVSVPLVREQSAATTNLELSAILDPKTIFTSIQSSVQSGATIASSQS